jgi:hypothetical protein
MIQRRPDMRENEQDQEPADIAVEREQLVRKRLVLADDGRQIEKPEERRRRAIGGIGDIADNRHRQQQHIQQAVHDR